MICDGENKTAKPKSKDSAATGGISGFFANRFSTPEPTLEE